jgi:hypothetical protein
MRTRLHPLLWAATAVVVIGALASCAPTPENDAGGTAAPTPSVTASELPTATPAPTATPSAEPDAVPLSIACAELITPDEMYAYNPSFALIDEAPPSGSLGARALDYDGTACTWVHESSGTTIVISVAQLSQAALAGLRSELDASSTPVTAFGVDGYFDVVGAAGEAQVLSGPYWLTATSPAFVDAADVQALVDAALATLG